MQPIETLRAGDLVWSRDAETGDEGYREVVRTFEREAIPTMDVAVSLSGGAVEVLRTTLEHPFWVDGHGWVPAGELAPNDRLAAREYGTSGYVLSLRSAPETSTVYNLEVADTHTYFVGAHQLWVHNACTKTPGNAGNAGDGKNLLKPGPHAGGSVPATGPRVTSAQKSELTKIGKETGCHSCGTKEFGTKSGKPVGDHQPPSALTKSGQEQRLYPQCTTCSAKQGAEVRKELTK